MLLPVAGKWRVRDFEVAAGHPGSSPYDDKTWNKDHTPGGPSGRVQFLILRRVFQVPVIRDGVVAGAISLQELL